MKRVFLRLTFLRLWLIHVIFFRPIVFYIVVDESFSEKAQ